MYTLYKMKRDELNEEFLASLKALFKGKTIEIAISETDEAIEDETEYLLKSPANRQRLMAAIENLDQDNGNVTLTLEKL